MLTDPVPIPFEREKAQYNIGEPHRADEPSFGIGAEGGHPSERLGRAARLALVVGIDEDVPGEVGHHAVHGLAIYRLRQRAAVGVNVRPVADRRELDFKLVAGTDFFRKFACFHFFSLPC